MWRPPQPWLKQLWRFLTVGLLALVIDLGAYEFLHQYLNGLPAKALSFVLATQVAYACNKYWTFAQPASSRTEFMQFNGLYLTTLGANVAVHSILTNFTGIMPLIALLLASATSSSMNFFGQKHWVFARSPDHSP